MNVPESLVRHYLGMSLPQTLYDMDANGRITYEAIGPRGALTSAAVWIIQKTAYDANNNPTSSKPLFGQVWDNRASLSF